MRSSRRVHEHMKFLDGNLSSMRIDEGFASSYYSVAERKEVEGMFAPHNELAQAMKRSAFKDERKSAITIRQVVYEHLILRDFPEVCHTTIASTIQLRGNDTSIQATQLTCIYGERDSFNLSIKMSRPCLPSLLERNAGGGRRG
jgi:hypothetical protein